MLASIYLAIPLMILLSLVETAVLPHFPILGHTPQLAFLVALCWGLLHGIEEGAIWAFFAGLFADLFSLTPVGVSSLAFMVGTTAVIWATQALPTSRFLLPLALGGLATIISFIVTVLLLRLFSTIADFQSVTILPSLILVNILTILPIYWLIYLIGQATQPRQVKV